VKVQRPPHKSARVGFYACTGPELARVVRADLAAIAEAMAGDMRARS
jgi:hypothetical protein